MFPIAATTNIHVFYTNIFPPLIPHRIISKQQARNYNIAQKQFQTFLSFEQLIVSVYKIQTKLANDNCARDITSKIAHIEYGDLSICIPNQKVG